MKNIIFIAPPAAGKGTVSARVCDKYNIPHISTGDLLRDEIKNSTKLGLEIKDATGSSEESLLFAGYDKNIGETIVKSKNMTVEKYLTIVKKAIS